MTPPDDQAPAPRAAAVPAGTPADTSAHWATAADIERALRARLRPTHLQVRDDSALHAGHAGARHGGHFAVDICSGAFAGLGRVARHRLVYDALSDLMPRGIHALAVQARTPDEA